MAEDLDFEQASTAADYTSDDIKTLDWKEHIRKRPGMYIGKLGDGSHSDDGIYVILKEVIDNSIDEFAMGFGKQIVVNITDDGTVEVRDYGRGIPLESVVDVSSKMNTGAKYDSDAFKKSVGLNGVGMKATDIFRDFLMPQRREKESVLQPWRNHRRLPNLPNRRGKRHICQVCSRQGHIPELQIQR